MPELPEVETTKRGLEPHLLGKTIRGITVRESRLRYPVSSDIDSLVGARITGLERRSKYIILYTNRSDSLIIHLGMSGSLRIVDPKLEYRKHDHVIFALSGGRELRYHDPRRFGLIIHLTEGEPLKHSLLASLGPEPLSDDFNADYLFGKCRNRIVAIKQLIMDSKIVVGVGNIYASESLFLAGIRPGTVAKRISKPRLEKLVQAIKQVLTESIKQGGTTLRDFVNSDGNPGYFRQRLFVYDREGKSCRKCGSPIKKAVMGQRATYWCTRCQK